MSITPLRTNDFTFYNRADYFTELARLCDTAGANDRILVASMNFQPGHIPNLIQALAGASKRGATVSLIFDAYAITYANRTAARVGAFVWPGINPRVQSRKHRAITNALAYLQKHGVQHVITNQPHAPLALPFVGRSHIKTAVVNDRVFIGGNNLHEPTEADEMISFVDPSTADWLYAKMYTLLNKPYTVRAFGAHDISHTVDQHTTLLLDVGIKGQSIILQNALDLINRAQKQLLITCQYFPNGATASALKRAVQRGVDVTVIYNMPQKHGLLEAPAQFASESRERLRMPKELFRHQLAAHKPFMHAKVLASEHEVMVGSHNYISAGVTFGTAELALRRHDPQFARAAADFIAQEVGVMLLDK